MADETNTTLDEKASNPGYLHRFAVFGSNLGKELGAGTLAIPGYLGDLANLTFRGKVSNYGERMKQGVVDGVSWAGGRIGIEGPEILDETDEGLALWGERAGMGASLLMGGAGILKGGATIATKAGLKFAAKEADDVAKAAAKGAETAASKATKAAEETTEEIYKRNTMKHSGQSLKLSRKLANWSDTIAETAIKNHGVLGAPIWVEGKYASQWLAHPGRMVIAHGAVGIADAAFLNSWLVDHGIRGGAFVGKGLLKGASYINTDAPIKIKEAVRNIGSAAKTAQENLAKESDVALKTIGEVTHTDPEKIKQTVTEGLDNTPTVLIPGGPVPKIIVRATQHLDYLHELREAHEDGTPMMDAATALAVKKAEEKVGQAEELTQLALNNSEVSEDPHADAPANETTLSNNETPAAPVTGAIRGKAAARMTMLREGWEKKGEKIETTKQKLEEERQKLAESARIASTKEGLDQNMQKMRDKAHEEKEHLANLARDKKDEIKAGAADAINHGKQYAERKKDQLVEAGITSGLSTAFHKAGEWMEKEWGIGTTGITIGTFALGGLTLGAITDNKMGGLVLGILAGIIWSAFGDDIKAGTSSTASSALSSVKSWLGMNEEKPGQPRPSVGFAPAPAAP